MLLLSRIKGIHIWMEYNNNRTNLDSENVLLFVPGTFNFKKQNCCMKVFYMGAYKYYSEAWRIRAR